MAQDSGIHLPCKAALEARDREGLFTPAPITFDTRVHFRELSSEQLATHARAVAQAEEMAGIAPTTRI